MNKIPLSQGLHALVDDVDYKFLSQWKWYAGKVKDGQYRAMRKETVNGKTYTIYMHRVIVSAPPELLVDHRDGNPLNNQRYNLRLCSYQQNGSNKRMKPRQSRTSQYKGVSRHRDKWRARVYYRGRNISLGNYESEFDAAQAYDRAAKQYFGTFACLNFPVEGRVTEIGFQRSV